MIIKCKFCDGSGREYNALRGYISCSVCNGAGEFKIDIEKDSITKCKFCNGSGQEYNALRGHIPCHVCEGLGIIERPQIKKPTSSKNDYTKRNKISNTQNYDIAVSFAGEDRGIVEKYVSYLRNQNVMVFYDTHEKADLWGEDLFEKLDDIYRNRAKYCVIFISKYYANKLWTNHERKSAQARAFRDNREYILPVRLDSTEIPGIRETIGYIDLRKTPMQELVKLTLIKLQR